MSAKLRIEWGDSILSLPRGVLAILPAAGGFELKVLLSIAAEDQLRNDPDALKVELCKRLDCTENAYSKALAFLTQNGMLTLADAPSQPAVDSAKPPPEQKPEQKEIKEPKKTLQSSTLPRYSESECADIIARSAELPNVIDMCQQLLGKIFTTADVEVIVGLCDHLNLSSDYIGCLVKYCADNGKKSLRYIEKTAISLFDDGICTGEALNDYLKRKEKLADATVQIKKLIGATNRELTTKEKNFISCWIEDWKYDIDIITKSWEVTIDRINEPKASYMNKVLENWKNDGLNTLADVEAYCAAYKKKKEAMNAGQSPGFQTDEIMEAIIKRSYGNG